MPRDQTICRSLTLSLLIWSSGLKPWLSSVRRQESQEPGSGFWIISSVTGDMFSSRSDCAAAGRDVITSDVPISSAESAFIFINSSPEDVRCEGTECPAQYLVAWCGRVDAALGPHPVLLTLLLLRQSVDDDCVTTGRDDPRGVVLVRDHVEPRTNGDGHILSTIDFVGYRSA